MKALVDVYRKYDFSFIMWYHTFTLLKFARYRPLFASHRCCVFIVTSPHQFFHKSSTQLPNVDSIAHLSIS